MVVAATLGDATVVVVALAHSAMISQCSPSPLEWLYQLAAVG